ncbi:MAG TPA: hypothetical protein VFG58_10590 [Solirubrobacterales bacterium]|nr:hypothetical protein [Solirubrobacterales bacterium]
MRQSEPDFQAGTLSPMSEPPAELLATALLSRAIFEPVTKNGSACISDAKLDAVWEFLQTEPPSLAHLEPVAGKRDWLGEMKEGIFGDFREGLATARYHLDRAELIENRITEIATQHEGDLFGQGNVGIGLHSRPLVAEYQAFEMALRRSLEYLAHAVAAYFKTDGSRIRSLADTISGRQPEKACRAATMRLEGANIEELIGPKSGPKSVRDRVAHHESVSPGVVNVGRKPDGTLWVRLHGDAEDLNASDPHGETETLSDVLTERIERAEVLALGLFEDLGLVRVGRSPADSNPIP